MVAGRSGWIMSSVVGLRTGLLTAVLIHWELTIVPTLKMLESDVSPQLVCKATIITCYSGISILY